MRIRSAGGHAERGVEDVAPYGRAERGVEDVAPYGHAERGVEDVAPYGHAERGVEDVAPYGRATTWVNYSFLISHYSLYERRCRCGGNHSEC